jgi:hypothetical protein
MALEKPPLATVEPGRPVTAQGWNGIVDGLSTLYDAVLAFGTGVLQVSVRAADQAVRGAQVVGVPLGEGNPVTALPLYGEVEIYALVGVAPGNWRVHISAPGFRPETRDVTVPSAEPLTVDLTAVGVVVPDLFGVGAQEALGTLGRAEILVDLILDVMGREVSRVTLPPQYVNAPVLLQVPEAGTRIDPAVERVRLVVAAAVERVPTVEMPSLIGLTQDEVTTVLERLGLRLGRVTVSGPGVPIQ